MQGSPGAPVCADIGEHLAAAGQQMAEKHRNTVASVILGGQDECFADAVPVERSVHQRLGIVSVRLPVGPLTLSLETAGDGIVAERLFLEAHLAQTGITLHKVADNECHLDDEFPVGVLLLACFLLLGTILEILALIGLAVFFCPGHSLGILLMIVDSFIHATQNLCLVDTLIAHSQILLKECRIDDRTGDTHTHRADREVALAAHAGHSDSGAGKTQQLLGYICRNSIVVQILNIVTVDTERRQTFLCVSGQNSCQIDSTGTLGSVEAPHGLGPVRVHVHCFGSVAPARCNRDCGADTFTLEFFGACSRFGNATDCAVGNDTLHRCAVGISEIIGYKFCYCFGKIHGFLFQTLAYASLTPVNSGTDADFRISFHCILIICLVIFIGFLSLFTIF